MTYLNNLLCKTVSKLKFHAAKFSLLVYFNIISCFDLLMCIFQICIIFGLLSGKRYCYYKGVQKLNQHHYQSEYYNIVRAFFTSDIVRN